LRYGIIARAVSFRVESRRILLGSGYSVAIDDFISPCRNRNDFARVVHEFVGGYGEIILENIIEKHGETEQHRKVGSVKVYPEHRHFFVRGVFRHPNGVAVAIRKRIVPLALVRRKRIIGRCGNFFYIDEFGKRTYPPSI